MEVIRVVTLRGPNLSFGFDVGGLAVTVVKPNEIDFLEPHVESQLHVQVADSSAIVKAAQSIAREMGIQGIKVPMANIQPQCLVIGFDDASQVISKKFRLAGSELADLLSPIFGYQDVLNHLVGGVKAHLVADEENAVNAKGHLVLQFCEVAPREARAVSHDEATLPAMPVLVGG